MLLAHTEVVYSATQSGIGIGSALAIVLSWHRNRSIILAGIAGFFTWLYFALTRRADEYRELR